ncbi:Sorting nexin mvp1 [Modicella reniformis]|uniref:Sorting nexin mvp1 n=1 Tax=Modicella reniformis TaxID=1440133 RepID=A0A9P6ST73_9FUNG|nr:Sorting nexin mvp1 [Modicella reniformis]
MVPTIQVDPPRSSESAIISQEQPQAPGSTIPSQEHCPNTETEQEPESQLVSGPPTPVADDEGTTPPESASIPAQQPKQVFSLFLTPEERKMKMVAEAASAIGAGAGAGASSPTLSKRVRKPKNKESANQLTFSTTSVTTPSAVPKPPSDPKTLVDSNASKVGETHRFFQEVKASQQLAADSLNGTGSKSGNPKGYRSQPQETPFPLQHQQFHGSETIDMINGVVAQLCGLNTASSRPRTVDSLLPVHKKKPSVQHGWYSLRASPDLGITAPQYTLKPRGKDSWIHWDKGGGQRWREWSERYHQLQRPTEKERQLINQKPNPAEVFESCQRVAENQPLWQQAWASTLLTTAGFTPGSSDVPLDLKFGELWIEKYKPKQGADVLGNRTNTEYLTRWLKGLEVSGWTLNPEEPSVGTGGLGSTKKASEIMGTARKRRKRPKRKGEMDDFVIYDDADDFEDPFDDYSDEDDGLFAAPKPLSSFTRIARGDPPAEDDQTRAERLKLSKKKKIEIKSNTILLSGPTGSCKTAAVYACAEESGYEVFEVSPGMRRTGKEVLGLVGEMAENHHVHIVSGRVESKDEISSILDTKTRDSPASTTPALNSTIYSFFQKSQQDQHKKKQGQEMEQSADEYMDDASDVDVEGSDDHDSPAAGLYDTQQSRSSSSSVSTSAKEDDGEDSPPKHDDTLLDLCSLLATTNPRQSLILLEEVDILFEDDKGFWTSIVTLLSKSKRPVVMTCNDTSKIPAAMLRFQEHLEFSRPSLQELHEYLSSVCKIEGYICSSEYILGLIKHWRYDVRKCLMQLQYDAGVIRSKPALASLFSGGLTKNGGSSSGSCPGTMTNANGKGGSGTSGAGTEATVRRKPQRLLRIGGAKGIVPASIPTASVHSKSVSSPLQELKQLEVQAQYAETMSLCDSWLQIKPGRVVQCYEMDQFEANKDDTVGQQHFPIYKRPSGADHTLMDQEIAELVEEGCESLYVALAEQQSFSHPHVFDEDVKKGDPSQLLAENFVPPNETLFRNVQRMQPALEQTLSLQALRFNLDVAFRTYAPLLRSMIHSETINTTVPTGKRTMRSGGHLRRHLDMLSESDRDLMLSASLSLPDP